MRALCGIGLIAGLVATWCLWYQWGFPMDASEYPVGPMTSRSLHSGLWWLFILCVLTLGYLTVWWPMRERE